MKKYLTISILISGLYFAFFLTLIKKKQPLYRYNKKLAQDAYYQDLEVQIEKIKKNPEWLAHVKKEAKIRGLTVPKMIEKSANYYLKTKKSND